MTEFSSIIAINAKLLSACKEALIFVRFIGGYERGRTRDLYLLLTEAITAAENMNYLPSQKEDI